MSRRLAFDPPMQTVRFRFADAFSPEDPVGQFVVGLAASLNDLNLLNSLLFPPDDPDRDDFTEGERSALMRMLLGVVWETHLLVVRAAKLSEVEKFLDAIAQAYPADRKYTGDQLVGFLRGDDGATAPTMRNVLRVARNATFHYPEIPDDALAATLRELADSEGALTSGRKMPSVRAEFADLVMLNLSLREFNPRDETTVGPFFRSLSETVVAIIHLAQVAIDIWLGRRDRVAESS